MAAYGRGYCFCQLHILYTSPFLSALTPLLLSIGVPNPPGGCVGVCSKRWPCSYLLLHDSLLEPRTNHGLAPFLLGSAPHAGPVGSLHHALLLASLDALLQGRVETALGAGGRGIGRADGRGGLFAARVVGRDGVVADAADGGCGEGAVGGAEGAGAPARCWCGCGQHGCCVCVCAMWVVEMLVNSAVYTSGR